MNESSETSREQIKRAIGRLRTTEGASWEDVTRFTDIRDQLASLVSRVESGLPPCATDTTDHPQSDVPAAMDPPTEQHP